MQRTRVVRYAVAIATPVAVFILVWLGGTWMGSHLQPWGIPFVIIGIGLLFVAMIHDNV